MKSVSHKSGLLSSFPAWFPGKLLSAGREQHAPLHPAKSNQGPYSGLLQQPGQGDTANRDLDCFLRRRHTVSGKVSPFQDGRDG